MSTSTIYSQSGSDSSSSLLSGVNLVQDCSIMYVNHFSAYNQLLQRINNLDEFAVNELAVNKEFKEFVVQCIDAIDDCNVMRSIKIERLDSMDESSYRILYHLNKTVNTSTISDETCKRTDRPTYRKILKLLFKKTSELKNMVVIDERHF